MFKRVVRKTPIAETAEEMTQRLTLELEQSRARTAALSQELSVICTHAWRLDGRQDASMYGQRCPKCLATRWAVYPEEAKEQQRLSSQRFRAERESTGCVIC